MLSIKILTLLIQKIGSMLTSHPFRYQQLFILKVNNIHPIEEYTLCNSGVFRPEAPKISGRLKNLIRNP